MPEDKIEEAKIDASKIIESANKEAQALVKEATIYRNKAYSLHMQAVSDLAKANEEHEKLRKEKEAIDSEVKKSLNIKRDTENLRLEVLSRASDLNLLQNHLSRREDELNKVSTDLSQKEAGLNRQKEQIAKDLERSKDILCTAEKAKLDIDTQRIVLARKETELNMLNLEFIAKKAQFFETDKLVKSKESSFFIRENDLKEKEKRLDTVNSALIEQKTILDLKERQLKRAARIKGIEEEITRLIKEEV